MMSLLLDLQLLEEDVKLDITVLKDQLLKIYVLQDHIVIKIS